MRTFLLIVFGMVLFFSCKKEEKSPFPSTVYAHTATMNFNIYVGGDLTNHGSVSHNNYFPQDPSEIWSLTFLSESEVEIGFGSSPSSIQTQKFDYYFKSDTLYVIVDPQNRDEDFYIGIGNYTSSYQQTISFLLSWLLVEKRGDRRCEWRYDY